MHSQQRVGMDDLSAGLGGGRKEPLALGSVVEVRIGLQCTSQLVVIVCIGTGKDVRVFAHVQRLCTWIYIYIDIGDVM